MKKLSTLDESVSSPLRMEQLTSETTGKRQQEGRNNHKREKSPEEKPNKLQNAVRRLKSMRQNTIKTLSSNESDTEQQEFKPTTDSHQQNQINQEEDDRPLAEIMFGGDYDQDEQNMQTNSFKRRVSRVLNKIDQSNDNSRRNTLAKNELSQSKRNSFLEKSKQQKVDFNMVPNLDIPNKRSGARMFLNERQNDSTNNDNQMQNAGYETGEDNKNSLDRAPQMPTLTKSTSEYRSQTNKVQVPQLNITNLGASKSSLTKNPFQEEDLNIQMQQSRNATLKYCSAIQLYYLGDLKQSFVIHSLSPVLNRVEISIRPQVVQNIPYGEETSRWQLEQIPDWQCAPALKSQGEVFRILPAVDHNYIKKIRKILKNKKELDPHNQFKYGEYLESLNEEMKYNLDVFEEYKNQYVKFGSQVMIMHENSQLFLKISSPSLSDKQSNFRLKLTPYISEKTMFKLLPSSKIQSEGEGKILENDQFFLGYTYDKILNKDLYLFQDPVQLERSATKKKSSLEKFENFNLELLFSESKKLPLHFGICESLDFDRSENIFKHLNGKVIQIKHIESELYLSQTIKRKENRILSQFFGSTNRYQLNKLIDYIPKVYGNEASVNVHFEPRASINTYWKVYASPHHRDAVFLENAVSKVRIKGLHLNAFSKGGARNENGEESLFYKIFQEENTLSSSLNVKRSSIHEISAEREYLWVEYLKFNRTENKYEFSKFGSMKDEDKGNLFDTFKIYTVDSYQQHSFEFLHHCFNSLKSFDSYQADNPECQEYERILKVIIQLKRFVQNKLSGLINVDEPYGEPNLTNQNLYKESFIIDEIIEIVDLIWPDENYMRKDFSGKSLQELNDVQSDEESFNSSTFSHNSDVHRETKVKLAEKIFELLKLICHDNFVLKEFVFFDIVPNIQKFVKLFLNNSTFQFGAGFRKQQDFQLFNYLVQDCDQYADYKEKTKYNIIFQFMKKLYVYINIILISQQKDNTSKVESNLFSILRSFCINPKGQPNNYHQKLLHDLFFFNQLEGIKFKLNQKPISAVKQSVKRSTVVIQNEDQLSVRKLQEDLKKFDENKFNKSQSLRALRSETQSKLQKNTNTRSNKLLQPIKEIRMDFGSKISDHDENKEEDNNLLSFVTTKSKGKKGQSFASSAQKDKKEQINEEMESHMESDYEELRVETIEDESFLIKRIHDITFNKLTSKVILENTKDSNLIKLELYFFADLCYLMNFDCPCSKFSSATVHNLLKLLTNKKSKLDTNIKAGLARILNTILRNHDDNVHSRPYFLRMYEKQEFVPPHGQVIISNEDTRSLVKLTRENFRLMSIQHSYNFSDFDFEMMRLTQYVIQSNLVFQKDFNEGYLYVTDIFEDIGGMFIRRKEIEKNQKISSSKSHLSILTNDQQSETTLNISEFQKQFKKMKKVLQQTLGDSASGMSENPIAWKMLNIEKSFTSYVERVLKRNHEQNLFAEYEKEDENQTQQENARLEMIKFFQWIINLRLDHLISNIINMFYQSLESFIQKENVDLDQLIKAPEKYYIFPYLSRLAIDFIQFNKSEDSKYSFLENIINANQDGSGTQNETILDIEEMYQAFLQNLRRYSNTLKTRAGFSSPIKDEFMTEQDEIKEEEKLDIDEQDIKRASPKRVNFKHNSSYEDVMTKDNLFENDDTHRQTEEGFISPRRNDDPTEKLQQDEKNEQKEEVKENTVTTSIKSYFKNMILSKFNRGSSAKSSQENIEIKKSNQNQSQFLDILIEVFVKSNDAVLQQETLRGMFRYLNIRKELLSNLQNTIVIFRQNVKSKIEQSKQTLRKCKMIIQDTTIWEMPEEDDSSSKKGNLEEQDTSLLDDLNQNLASPLLRGSSKHNSSNLHSKKQEYSQKLKEHQKNQQQLIQNLAFSRSNKTATAKLNQLDQFLNYLEEISEFFNPYSAKRPVHSKNLSISSNINVPQFSINIVKDEEDLKVLASENLDNQLPFVQQDLQYAFLAIQGHEILMDFMKRYREIRQESIRTLFIQSKVLNGQPFNKSHESNLRIIYSFKALLAYKKCYEILIKFIYNNKTTKQVLLNYLDDILLFNSEYYMQSKMISQIHLFDFDLMNHVIDNNLKIKNISTILIPKLTNLVSYIHKIIEFPKKPLIFAPMILKVYSNIIANCDNAKINDQVIDLILKEEAFFQIQQLLLSSNLKKHDLNCSEHLNIMEKFLKGISQILKIHNVRMTKKKFYQIFQNGHDIEHYFKVVKELFNQNVEKIKQKLNGKQSDYPDNQSTGSHITQRNEDGKEENKFSSLARNQSASLLSKIEEEIIIVSKKFVAVQSFLIVIIYKLFFEVKGTQKELLDKVEEMQLFIKHRVKDLELIESFVPITDVDNWEEYQLINDSIEICRKFCLKYSTKSNSQVNKFHRDPSMQSQSSFLIKHATFNFAPKAESKFKSFKQPLRQPTDVTDQIDTTSIQLTTQQSDKSSQVQNKQSLLKRRMTKVIQGINQNQIAQKKEQIFRIFKWNLLHDENLRTELKKEMHQTCELLLRKFKAADDKGSELDQQKYHQFFVKLVEYSNQFQSKTHRLVDVKILVEMFSQFIDLTNEGQSYKGEGFEAKTQIQEKLNSIGAVKMVLEMMCADNNEYIDEIFPQLLYFSNRILDGAQNNIQDFFTEYLTKNEKSINLFERCYHLIEKEISLLQKMNHETQENEALNAQITKENSLQLESKQTAVLKNERKGNVFSDKLAKAYDKQINVQKQILKFFKNLCENHNTKMQLLIGNQQNPDKNFDMVSLTVNYLHSLISNINLSKRNYSNAQNCCISLAEYVQGPCHVNQQRIKDANFYQIAVQILSIKPNLIQDLKVSKDKDLMHDLMSPRTSQGVGLVSQRRRSIRLSGNQGSQMSFNLFDSGKPKSENVVIEATDFQLTNFMIQKLKLNCSIILLSLLEQRSADDPLLLSMKRSIPLDVIKQNIMYEYFLFCKDYNKFLSRENFFRHVLTQSDYEVKEELIIEVGFNLYFLLKRWAENKKTNDSQLDDLMDLLQNQERGNSNLFMSRFEDTVIFFKQIGANLKHLYKKFMKKNRTQDTMHKRSRLEYFKNQEQNMTEALMFFKTNSASIDVLIKNSIEQVHFPYMPYCTYISEEEKVDFYNALPTDRDKEKIEVLVNNSTDLIRRMKIEYQFKKFFIDYPLIGVFVYHTEQWKSLAYYTILILNAMNLYSFSAANGRDRLFEPEFFSLSTESTEALFKFFGFFQMMFAIFINFTVISKRAIYHYQLVFRDQKNEEDENNKQGEDQSQNQGEEVKVRTKTEMLKDAFDYTVSAIQDFQLLYYLGYLIFSFVGFMYHPFFYSYHMIDMIIRNPYLKNVLKAIYRPRYELFNTFVLFLCLQYIFAMISYIFFFEDFEKGECSSLSQCFLVIIDQTFKNDGGIGTFMSRSYPADMDKGEKISIRRFVFDNTFNVILVILVVEIISGIIIDTFGALREEHNKITDSIENKCMICGKNRDQIEKEYQDLMANEENQGATSKLNEEKAFEIHKRDKHNIYDYIFFLAYLQEKPELEYTGLESFVFEKFSELNNTWFPIYKVGGDKAKDSASHQEEDNDDNEGEDDGSNDQPSDEEEEDQKEDKNKNGNKMIMEYLKGLNEKIDQISQNIGQNNEQDDEDINRYNSNQAVGRVNTGNQRVLNTQNSRNFQNQSLAPQTITVGNLGQSPRLSGVKSSKVSGARAKLIALNAFGK